ncbi:CbaC protein [Natronorubrum sp. JWXQ-INN-674]|uniref:CbaC protein n=1 Tax=Natronorubrum halalkaliphilum TaxID=2691917 RepID=A0A6B0VSA5_9EURY|nr:CbaC protein [Natronorubrum halalkaliphilum]MXV63662.1 CbaC protein [Natronorubrum halalkaliphilum]
MRLSWPQLLIVIALLIVILVELRTVLAFFEIHLSVTATAVLAVVVIGALVLWTVLSSADRSE